MKGGRVVVLLDCLSLSEMDMVSEGCRQSLCSFLCVRTVSTELADYISVSDF